MQTEIKCPQCRRLVAWQGNPNRPFCSERCRLVDLGQWAEESYVIPGPPQEQLSEENIISFHEEKQKVERS